MNLFKRALFTIPLRCIAIVACIIFMPHIAYGADYAIVDALNLAPLIPTVLDALMMVASGGYEFFVGNGDGIIYILVWGFLAVSLAMYVLKMYFPKTWVGFFGFSGGGEMSGGIDGMTIATNMLKPGIRAIIAVTVLLQIKPVYVMGVSLCFGDSVVYFTDIQQIDQPYLDSQSNGLVYMIDRMRDQNLFAHINLVKGERSQLSELASNLM